jgi:hypothetical protein
VVHALEAYKTKAMTKFLASIMRLQFIIALVVASIFYIALFICQHSPKITNATVRLEAIKESKTVIEMLRGERQDESV